MHESAITDSLIALALEKANEAGATRIVQINLVVGELSGVVGSAVQFYFDVVARNTIAAGAVLNFVTKPTQLHCRKCDITFTPTEHVWTCPNCHEADVEILAGRECYMESIEVQ